MTRSEISVRKSADRGKTEAGWLSSRHTFSFGEYYDEEHMGFRTLRVINDDVVQPAKGFGTHGHKDMEIISVVLSGALAHKDDLGNGMTLTPGEVQVMSAGLGIRHSEFNPSADEPAHFLQIWIVPDRRGHAPRWEQRAFPAAARTDRLCRVAGPPRGDDALLIHQDADVYCAAIGRDAAIKHAPIGGKAVWVQVAEGEVVIDGTHLATGDGMAISHAAAITIRGIAPRTDLLVFDV